ncbi:hypothetical protein GGS24DRAFT_484973 [Hypoxylon argillaceum]|nr:hypothetical protein GGS24DRAFT_484973 [Hypoxylon argillaceum]KAI1151361.1 hypothetical protein F4825DRAFT_423197 [Nemania diffusa]
MVKENDVIAIIIILLFIVIAAIAFGIYRIVHVARHQGTLESTSASSTEDELA